MSNDCKENVNMTDINFSSPPGPDGSSSADDSGDPAVDHYDLIELLFFAYRDFISEPDAILDGYGFGRAHHRVLHFVDRNPGLSVADLLEILKITKQSLARVLKQLIDRGFVTQRAGERDRRQRLLFATPQGERLARQLAALQSQRFERALADMSAAEREMAAGFLLRLINPQERAQVLSLVERARAHGDTR